MVGCSRSSRYLLYFVVLLAALVGVMRLGSGPLRALFRRDLINNGEREQNLLNSNLFWNTEEASSSSEQSRPPLHLFNDEVIRSPEEILSSTWLKQLRSLLRTVNIAGQVSITFANYGYIESLLNWLVVAQVRIKPPILNVIVVCLDEEVFRVLDERDIPSVYISPHAVTRNSSILEEKKFASTVWLMRFVIYRLINYFGYDVVSYDTDAIVMKNPQPVFNEHRNSDIVSSAGTFPFKLGKRWGFTMCMGVIMFRSSPKTGKILRHCPR